MNPRVEIHYCQSCGWLARATWMAQELLASFERKLGEVALLPADAGVFEIWLDDERLFSRDHDDSEFPDLRTIKRAIQDKT